MSKNCDEATAYLIYSASHQSPQILHKQNNIMNMSLDDLEAETRTLGALLAGLLGGSPLDWFGALGTCLTL